MKKMISIIIKHIFAYFGELWKNREERVQTLASSGASESPQAELQVSRRDGVAGNRMVCRSHWWCLLQGLS